MNIYRVETKDYESDEMNYGFVVAEDYKHAMEQALDYYVENETEYITIKYISDYSVLIVKNKEFADEIEEWCNI